MDDVASSFDLAISFLGDGQSPNNSTDILYRLDGRLLSFVKQACKKVVRHAHVVQNLIVSSQINRLDQGIRITGGDFAANLSKRLDVILGNRNF